MKIYKIKDPDTEKYSAGMQRGFLTVSKKGKTWNSLGALKSHLNLVEELYEKVFNSYDHWLVIEISEHGFKTIGKVKDFRKEG